jgi:D-xylulose reductase
MGTPEVAINMAAVLSKELVIKGSFRYGVRISLEYFIIYLSFVLQHGDYPLAIALVSQGKIDLKPLVTHR